MDSLNIQLIMPALPSVELWDLQYINKQNSQPLLPSYCSHRVWEVDQSPVSESILYKIKGSKYERRVWGGLGRRDEAIVQFCSDLRKGLKKVQESAELSPGRSSFQARSKLLSRILSWSIGERGVPGERWGRGEEVVGKLRGLWAVARHSGSCVDFFLLGLTGYHWALEKMTCSEFSFVVI